MSEKLNVEQATRYLGVSRATFTRWRKAGVIGGDQGRWTTEELDMAKIPSNKPRGRQPKKPETESKQPETAAEAKTEAPAPEEKAPEPEKKSGTFDPSDPFKVDLPQKRPRAEKPAGKTTARATDDEGFYVSEKAAEKKDEPAPEKKAAEKKAPRQVDDEGFYV